VRSLLVCVAILVVVAPVAADPTVDVHVETSVSVSTSGDARDPGRSTFVTPLTRSHWEAGLGMVFPMQQGGEIGVHAALGRTFGPLRVTGEYSLGGASTDRTVTAGWITSTAADCGQRERFGVAARYRVAAGTPDAGGGLYVEAGVGRATTAWKSFGKTTRDDVLLGVGVDMLAGGVRSIGMDLGARITIAEPEQPDGPRDTTVMMAIGLLVGG
jgi:hypothetical protein